MTNNLHRAAGCRDHIFAADRADGRYTGDGRRAACAVRAYDQKVQVTEGLQWVAKLSFPKC
jgi:hypothetical protein